MTTTKSIGSGGGRDYSTIQAWEDAQLSVLLDAQVGECYADSEFVVAGAVVTFGGITTSATFTLTLKAASGQGFRDNANVQTNALRYNAANGVAIRSTAAYSITIDQGGIDYITLFGLQIAYSGSNNRRAVDATAAHAIIDNCIIESNSTVEIIRFVGGTVRNTLLVKRTSNSSVGINGGYGSAKVFVNVTLVRPSDFTAGSNAFSGGSNNNTCKNVVAMGFTAFCNTVGNFTGSNNATDLSSVGFGSSNQVSLTYGSQFVTTTDATRDFRAKAGGSILDTAATDTTNVPAAVDIANTARPQGSAWDIGCWEFIPQVLARSFGVIFG